MKVVITCSKKGQSIDKKFSLENPEQIGNRIFNFLQALKANGTIHKKAFIPSDLSKEKTLVGVQKLLATTKFGINVEEVKEAEPVSA